MGDRPAASVLVVMGVSGSGKTTIARMLAERLDWAFAEGDDFHPDSNVRKMSQGHPLDDADRRPWLDAIAEWVGRRLAAGENGVVTCSALKRAYRDRLVRAGAGMRFVYLELDRDTVRERLRRREGHFMPTSLLASQFATLEEPADDEPVLRVDGRGTPDEIVARILEALPA